MFSLIDSELLLNYNAFSVGSFSGVGYKMLAKSISDSGKTVILVSHDLTNSMKYADFAVILDEGKAVFSGSCADCEKSGAL